MVFNTELNTKLVGFNTKLRSVFNTELNTKRIVFQHDTSVSVSGCLTQN